MVPSRIILTILVLCLAILCYQLFLVKSDEYVYLLIPLVLTTILSYAFQAQINYFFYNKKTPDLAPELKKLLNQFDPFYQKLSGDIKQKFNQRLSLYLLSKDFISTTEGKISEDVKALIASQHIKLSLGKEVFLYPEYERVGLSPHPFLSPKFEDIVHASETEHEDGMILLSKAQTMQSLVQPGTFFNLALYEYAQAFIHLNKSSFEGASEINDEDLESCGTWNIEDTRKQIGLPEINLTALGLVIFLDRPEKLKACNPKLYQLYEKALAFDTLQV